jgi:alkylation response protein AidB-like acyl-CoA dehydrogenase
LTGLEFEVPAELEELRRVATEQAREWARRSPVVEDSWVIGYDREVAREMAGRGWLGMTWPVDEGGQGRTPLERMVVFEALIGNGAPIAASYFADRQIGPTLLQYATPEQRQRWLPGIVDGTAMWCIGMSEPDAGSDVAAIGTRAVRDGDDWVVSGQKIWTSGAATADWCYLIARTDPDAPRHAGLSELVVDMRSPGITVAPIVDMTRNAHFCEVYFDDVRVPAANLIGEENGSFRQVMRQLEHERGGIDRLVSNYVLYRDVRESGRIDTSDALVRQEVAAIESGFRVGRLMVMRETMRQGPPGFSAVTKTFCTELEQRVADFYSRNVGAAGLLWESDDRLGARTARAICYSPSYTIMGGTTQVLRNIIAERVLNLPR